MERNWCIAEDQIRERLTDARKAARIWALVWSSRGAASTHQEVGVCCAAGGVSQWRA